MQFLGKFDKIVCWRPPGGLVPPPRGNPGSAIAKAILSSYFSLPLRYIIQLSRWELTCRCTLLNKHAIVHEWQSHSWCNVTTARFPKSWDWACSGPQKPVLSSIIPVSRLCEMCCWFRSKARDLFLKKYRKKMLFSTNIYYIDRDTTCFKKL